MTRDNEPTCWHRIEATIARIRQQIPELGELPRPSRWRYGPHGDTARQIHRIGEKKLAISGGVGKSEPQEARQDERQRSEAGTAESLRDDGERPDHRPWRTAEPVRDRQEQQFRDDEDRAGHRDS